MCCMGNVCGTLHHNTSNKTLIIVQYSEETLAQGVCHSHKISKSQDVNQLPEISKKSVGDFIHVI